MIDLPGMATVWDALPEARVVGGAVRDALAGRAVADVDFAAPLTPEDMMDRLHKADVKIVPTGLAHGTVTAVVNGRGFEVTTLRRDVETDGRHAAVAFTDDWKADASRRDFTINAMSADRDWKIYDYFGGRDDLEAGHVRFVGQADERVAEDYLRILRFFRFFAGYGQGTPDRDAVAAIARFRRCVEQLSAERVWSEIKLLLRTNDPRAAVTLMQKTGVLKSVFPEADVERLTDLVERGAPLDPLLRIVALSNEDPVGLATRLKLSGAEQARLLALRESQAVTPDVDDTDLRRALAETDPAMLIGRTWLAQDDTPGWSELRARIAAMPRPVFPLQGRDVTALGVPPGPRVGEILADVKCWWMAGGCDADAQACLARVKV